MVDIILLAKLRISKVNVHHYALKQILVYTTTGRFYLMFMYRNSEYCNALQFFHVLRYGKLFQKCSKD